MREPLLQAVFRVAGTSILLLIASAALSQGIPEDRNINIVGVNPPVADGQPDLGVPDLGLKQQNEPACAMKPGRPLQILCAFNDYRGVDNPAIGDAWEGYAYSINGGLTWFSDLLPGHPGDTQNIGLEFAADPQVAAAPGVALISYIAADRGENADGGLYLQRMFEVTREAGAPWVPEMLPIEVERGKANKFIDKPFMLLHPEPAGSGTVSVSATLKDGSAVTQEAPAARIFLAHTEFFGNANNPKSKMYISTSDDYGDSWTRTKVSQGTGLNQSASIAALGDTVCAVWRRFETGNKDDAILAACSTDRGEKFAKPVEVSAPPDFIPFDQGTTEASFRVNSYPVIANDGSQFYAFWASRKNEPSTFYARIVYSTSVDGSNWTAPIMLEDAADGHQFMPSVAAARGTIQLAWYDTRLNLFQADFIQDLLDDSSDPPTKIIRNKADVRTLQIIDGVATSSVQVSRYVEGSLEPGDTPVPLEFNFLNDRIFKQGTVPFAGDYPNVAAPTFRVENGEWVSNITPSTTVGPDDFLVSWSDHRDVRGNVWEDLILPTVYTPADLTVTQNTTDGANDSDSATASDDAQSALVAKSLVDRKDSDGKESLRAVSLADNDSNTLRADAEPDPTDVYGVCVPGTNQDRTRNQNVYSSIVRPGVSIDSPSASKPTGSVQRAHVIWVSNNTETAATYTLTIDDQPTDAPSDGRATFLQVPVAPFTTTDGLLTEIEVEIEPNSTAARTVYVTSQTTDPEIGVSVTDGAIINPVVFGTITLNADVLTPDIQNPDVQNPDVQNPDIQNAEVHNPDVQNVVITRVANPDVQNPDVQNPDVQNPDVQNPDYQNPDVQNPDIQNPDVQNTTLAGSSTENPDVAYDGMLTNTDREGYTDVSFEVTNNGNTTTSFNLDAFVNADTTGLKTQLIATRTHVIETSKDCVQGKLVQNQVIFNETDPDLDIFDGNSNDGVFGDGSAYIAPGETILVTLRIWGDPELLDIEPETLTVGVQVEAQSCNSEDKGPGTTDCDPPVEQTIPTSAGIGFDFIPPLTAGNRPDSGPSPLGSGINDLNIELERFGVEWEEQDGVLYLTDASFVGGFPGLSGPFLAFNSDGYPDPDGTHTARFVCPDGSGRLATVASASVNVADTESSLEASSYDINNVLLETVDLYPDDTATFNFTLGPIASIEFTDSGADGHLLDNLDYEGSQCLDAVPFTQTTITGDTSILNSGSFIVANNMNFAGGPITVNGVTFGTDQSGFTTPGGAWLFSGGDFSTDPITAGWSADLDQVLSANQFVRFGQTHGELTISGLTIGTDYRLQLLFSNDLNTTANKIEVTVEGNTWVLDLWQPDAINLIAEFTASGTSVIVEFDAGVGATSESGRGILSGYALHGPTVIP